MVEYLDRAFDSVIGDANTDGIFDSGDLVQVFRARKFSTSTPASWLEGDWNCNGTFGTDDLVLAFQQGGFLAESVAGRLDHGGDDQAVGKQISKAMPNSQRQRPEKQLEGKLFRFVALSYCTIETDEIGVE